MKKFIIIAAAVSMFGMSCKKSEIENPIDRDFRTEMSLKLKRPDYPQTINPRDSMPIIEDRIERPFRYDFPDY